MRQTWMLALLIVGGFFGFIGYLYAMIDWIQDVQTGVYERNHAEAVLETLALAVYTFLAIRFLRTKLTL